MAVRMYGSPEILKREKEVSDPMLINFNIATLVGCWDIETDVKWKKNIYAVYHVINVGLFSILPILEILDIFSVLHDVEKLNFNLCATAGTSMLIAKQLLIMSHRTQLMEYQKVVWNNFDMPNIGMCREDSAILRKADRETRLFLVVIYSMVLFTVTFWGSMPILDHGEDPFAVAIRIWLPIDQKRSPIYEIICSVELYMLYMYAGAIMTIDLIFFGFVHKFVAHFSILIKNIRAIGDKYRYMNQDFLNEDQEIQCYEGLQQAIIHHQKVIRVANGIGDIFKPIILLHFFAMAALMCVQIFDMLMVPKTKLSARLVMQFGYFSSCLLDTFIYSYHGQALIDKSKELMYTIYSTPWYNMSPRCKQTVRQMIVNAQNNPLTMKSGGGLFAINYGAFVAVMKTSYNFLAIMNRMRRT